MSNPFRETLTPVNLTRIRNPLNGTRNALAGLDAIMSYLEASNLEIEGEKWSEPQAETPAQDFLLSAYVRYGMVCAGKALLESVKGHIGDAEEYVENAGGPKHG
jgi:hypothetical protein